MEFALSANYDQLRERQLESENQGRALGLSTL